MVRSVKRQTLLMQGGLRSKKDSGRSGRFLSTPGALWNLILSPVFPLTRIRLFAAGRGRNSGVDRDHRPQC